MVGDPKEHSERAETPADFMTIVLSWPPVRPWFMEFLVSWLCLNTGNVRICQRTPCFRDWLMTSHVASACAIRVSLRPATGLRGPIQREVRIGPRHNNAGSLRDNRWQIENLNSVLLASWNPETPAKARPVL